MDSLEQFKAWIDSEFSDCSWYFEAKIGKYLHLYRGELDDFWSYEETVAWLTWQYLQAELEEKDKRVEKLENRIEEGLGFIDKFHCEGWLSDLDNAEKALRGEHE